MSYAGLVTLLMPKERGFGNCIVSLKSADGTGGNSIASGSVCNNCKESQYYFPCHYFQDLCKCKSSRTGLSVQLANETLPISLGLSLLDAVTLLFSRCKSVQNSC